MKQRQMLILLVAVVTSLARGEETAFCKSMCDSERRECRGMAETLSRTDTAPILSMGKNPYERQAERWQKIPPEAWAQNDYRNRRFERIRNCEDRFMLCTSSCSDPPAAPSTGSVVIYPKNEH